MAFVMVPPPQITPRMPRERRENFFDVNMGHNNDAMMMALLQMMLQQQSEKGRLSLDERIAESNRLGAEQQRELTKMQMSAMARESGLKPANENLLKRQAIAKAALDEDKTTVSRDLTNEITVSASNSQGGKALKKFAAHYNSIGYGDGEAREMLGKLQNTFKMEMKNAKSTAEQIGIATAYQNGLLQFLNTPGVSPEIQKKAAAEHEGLTPSLSVLASPAIQNQYVNETLSNMDRDYQTEWTKRMIPAQEEVEGIWGDPNLSTEMKVAKSGSVLQRAASDFPRMKRRDASLASAVQEPETVVVPPGPTAGTIIERGLQSLEKSTVGRVYQEPGTRTGQEDASFSRTWEGSQTPMTDAFHDFFLTPDRNIITDPLKNLWTGLRATGRAFTGGSWDDPAMQDLKNRQTERGLSNQSPDPLQTETYTPDGWLKTPAAPQGDYDFLWNP